MTGSPIDASLRRPILPTKDRGTEIPDSQSKLAASPQLIMEAGAVRPVYRFEDGDGLTDAFGNKYDGYGTGTGDSLTWTHTPSEDLDAEIDDADDLDFLQYDGSREKWVSRTYVESELMRLTNTILPVDLDVAIYDSVNEWWTPVDRDELSAALDIPLLIPSTIISDKEILVANASGEFDSIPQVSKDFFFLLIRDPELIDYKMAIQLPYDIAITANFVSIVTGSATVTFPVGTILAGNPVEITITVLGGGVNEFLSVQLDFTRNLLVGTV